MIFDAVLNLLNNPDEERRFLVPEVVQTSSMDCGPATLKALLEGFGIPVNYARLREACQTDVDGTSIDTVEAVAVQLGLNAEQVMIPVDHLFMAGEAMPAIVVVRQASGLTHFVVAWSQFSNLVQVMDPATGLNALQPFLTTLDNWGQQILNDFNQHTSQGFVEGMNNRIKLILRRGFGYRNFVRFSLRILIECGLLP
jgi:ABC-type bacteriocin/lantibiotic exporter with double-glycine peptidase domain